MPRGIYPKGNKGLFKKGMIPWSKGKKVGRNEKQVQKLTGRKLSPEHIANRTRAQTGLKRSLESRKRMKIARSGAGSYFWKGGVTKPNMIIRMSLEMRLWREAVFKRDNWTCIWCKVRGGKLSADHIKPFALYPELRFSIDNGRTLCRKCHLTTDTFGIKSWTKK